MINPVASLKIAFFTICSANYLSYALTLGRFLSEVEGGIKLHVFLADRLPEGVAVPDDHIAITSIEALAIDDLDDMAFRYSVLELNTAIKPYCFEYLFDVLRYDAAIYLDPDIMVLKPLDHVRNELHNGAACVLTPHITSGLKDGGKPDEDTFLTCGVFNLGFAAFANSPNARSFIKWWATKTRRDCIVAIDRGIFTDQSYCNFAPCFIERFISLRNPGYNVAYWNLVQRTITKRGDDFFADGELIRFVHFSGIEPRVPTSFSKHQNRFNRRDVGVLKRLTEDYTKELDLRDRFQSGRFSEIPYSFGSFRDGRTINDVLRVVYRRYQDELQAGQSPFDLSPSFFNDKAKEYQVFGRTHISRLYATVWHLRIDLQRAYDLGTPEGQVEFQNWASVRLRNDYGIDDAFIVPTSLATDATVPALEWRRWQKDQVFDRAITSRSFMLRNLLRRQLFGEERTRDYWNRRLTAATEPSLEANNLSAGLDVYGFFTAETGVGQAARGFVEVLQQTSVQFSCQTLSADGFENEVAFDHVASPATHDTALICANADQLVRLDTRIGGHMLRGRRKLAHWAWELPVFPAAWAAAIDQVDEIWTASRFVARSVQAATRKVTRVVPYVVEATDFDRSEARSAFDLPCDSYVFLTVFDINSFPSRKNPLAVVRTFRDAFPNTRDKSQLLIIKFHGTDGAGFRGALAEAISDDPRITTIDAVYSIQQMSMLRAACDALVSLHRSEGFGLNIAEAMAAGKLAIATYFSGNEDFMTRENSLPIPFKMTPVGKNEYPYGTGQWWAEPDHDATVEAMRWAVDHVSEGQRLAEWGKQQTRSSYSKAAIANILIEALAGRSTISFD